MFEQMVESATINNHRRRRFFVLATILVSSIFIAVLIADLYAANFDIGYEQLDYDRLLTPALTKETEPEKQEQNQSVTTNRRELNTITRTVNMARVDESQFVPDKWSVVKNRFMSRPDGSFRIDPAAGDSGMAIYEQNNNGTKSGPPVEESNLPEDSETAVKPPLMQKPSPDKLKPASLPKNVGIVNGIAIQLRKPKYPPAAIALNISDTVQVQVTIDENGNVISAKAVKGNPILRNAAEDAARQSRFTPTLSNGLPVKVTGLIIYNFIR